MALPSSQQRQRQDSETTFHRGARAAQYEKRRRRRVMVFLPSEPNTPAPTVALTTSPPTLSFAPSDEPSVSPSLSPSALPSPQPSVSVLPTRTLNPSATPSNRPTPSPSASPTTAAPTNEPTAEPTGAVLETNTAAANALEFTEAQFAQGFIHTCQHTIPSQYDDYVIVQVPYTYTLLLPETSNVPEALLEGERQIGQGVAEILCAANTSLPDSPLVLEKLNSWKPDALSSDDRVTCQSQTANTQCHVVTGTFEACLFVKDTTTQLEIDSEFQTVLGRVLPSVVQTMTTYQTVAGPEPDSDNDDDDMESLTLLAALLGGVALCCLASVICVFVCTRQRQRQRRQTHNALDAAKLPVKPPKVEEDPAQDDAYDDEDPDKTHSFEEDDDFAKWSPPSKSDRGDEDRILGAVKRSDSVANTSMDSCYLDQTNNPNNNTNTEKSTSAEAVVIDDSMSDGGETLAWLGVDVLNEGKALTLEPSPVRRRRESTDQDETTARSSSHELCGQDYELSDAEGSVYSTVGP